MAITIGHNAWLLNAKPSMASSSITEPTTKNLLRYRLPATEANEIDAIKATTFNTNPAPVAKLWLACACTKVKV